LGAIGITPRTGMLYDASLSVSGSLVPVTSGRAYSVDSPPDNGLVTRELAAELHKVLERFAHEAGFNHEQRVGVFFRPGIFGHHQVGRAADIYAVGGIGLDGWKTKWDDAMNRAIAADGADESRTIRENESGNNLGWRFYKALQSYGRWAQPYGYPIQLFGPWTRTEGPWKYISDFLLRAHRDHVHVAK
jgi:hypothetical protein